MAPWGGAHQSARGAHKEAICATKRATRRLSSGQPEGKQVGAWKGSPVLLWGTPCRELTMGPAGQGELVTGSGARFQCRAVRVDREVGGSSFPGIVLE